MRIRIGVFALAALCFAAPPAGAQRQVPLTIIVPFAAGAGTDLIARALAPSLSETLERPVVIDNRPGGDGVIGAVAASRAEPSGDTIFLTSNTTHAVNPNTKAKLPYDAVKDYEPIALIAKTYLVLVTRPGFPAASLSEVVREVKNKAGKVTYGAGNMSSRLVAELFRLTIGSELVYVPYKGNAQAMGDVAAGHIDLMFADTVTAQSFLKTGKVNAFLVTSDQRLAFLPNIPTATEAKMPDLDVSGWAAVFAPAHTPADVIAKLNRAIGIAAKSEAATKLFETTNLVPAFGSPDDLAKFMNAEISRWGRVVEAAQIGKD